MSFWNAFNSANAATMRMFDEWDKTKVRKEQDALWKKAQTDADASGASKYTLDNPTNSVYVDQAAAERAAGNQDTLNARVAELKAQGASPVQPRGNHLGKAPGASTQGVALRPEYALPAGGVQYPNSDHVINASMVPAQVETYPLPDLTMDSTMSTPGGVTPSNPAPAPVAQTATTPEPRAVEAGLPSTRMKKTSFTEEKAPKYSASEIYHKRYAQQISDMLMKQGQIEDAEKYSAWSKSKAGSQYGEAVLSSIMRGEMGDQQGALEDLVHAYNLKFPDGRQAKGKLNEDGTYAIDVVDEKTGKRLFGTGPQKIEDIYKAAAWMASPAEMYKSKDAITQAAIKRQQELDDAETRRTHEIKLKEMDGGKPVADSVVLDDAILAGLPEQERAGAAPYKGRPVRVMRNNQGQVLKVVGEKPQDMFALDRFGLSVAANDRANKQLGLSIDNATRTAKASADKEARANAVFNATKVEAGKSRRGTPIYQWVITYPNGSKETMAEEDYAKAKNAARKDLPVTKAK